jgi:ATP-binding cassette subfamily C protein LapB
MDMATEKIFVTRLQEAIRPDQTLVVTTHRNAILSLVNRLVVIEGGAVAIDGPRDAVLKRLADGQPRPVVAAASSSGPSGGYPAGDSPRTVQST